MDWASLAMAGFITVTLAGAYGCTVAPGLSWANDGADGGDLVTAAVVGGVAHPSGYPTYLLLVQLALRLPVGGLAFRAALFSVVCACLACLTVYSTARERCAPVASPWAARAAAAIAALALGFSPALWSQAVIAEVGALNALFCALLWRLASVEGTSGRHVALAALAAGFALGNHLTVLPTAFAALALLIVPRVGRLQRAGLIALFLVLGLAVYIILPLRAAASPAVNWGLVNSVESFWWLVSGAPYQHHLRWPAPGGLTHTVADLACQFGLLGLPLACWGFLAAMRSVSAAVAAGAAAGVGLVFAASYGVRDGYVYLIPPLVALAPWVAVGVARLLMAASARSARTAGIAFAALLVTTLLAAGSTAGHVDASRNDQAAKFLTEVMTVAPANAIVLTREDRDTFALWYGHYALGARPDITVISVPLLNYRWYRDNLRAVYPSLRLPAAVGRPWAVALARANQRLPVCITDPAGTPALRCEEVKTLHHRGEDS